MNIKTFLENILNKEIINISIDKFGYITFELKSLDAYFEISTFCSWDIEDIKDIKDTQYDISSLHSNESELLNLLKGSSLLDINWSVGICKKKICCHNVVQLFFKNGWLIVLHPTGGCFCEKGRKLDHECYPLDGRSHFSMLNVIAGDGLLAFKETGWIVYSNPYVSKKPTVRTLEEKKKRLEFFKEAFKNRPKKTATGFTAHKILTGILNKEIDKLEHSGNGDFKINIKNNDLLNSQSFVLFCKSNWNLRAIGKRKETLADLKDSQIKSLQNIIGHSIINIIWRLSYNVETGSIDSFCDLVFDNNMHLSLRSEENELDIDQNSCRRQSTKGCNDLNNEIAIFPSLNLQRDKNILFFNSDGTISVLVG